MTNTERSALCGSDRTGVEYQQSNDRELMTEAETDRGESSWHTLTVQLATGDENSCQQFYDAFFDVMYREARRLIGDDENSCLDIVHDAMLKSMRSIRPISEYEPLRQWVRLVVKSVAYDWLRRKIRRRECAMDLQREPAERSREDAEIQTQARLAWIEEQLNSAPPDLRHLLSMRYRIGMTLQQIGSALKLKPGAVDGRIRRAVEQLRRQAEIEFPND